MSDSDELPSEEELEEGETGEEEEEGDESEAISDEEEDDEEDEDSEDEKPRRPTKRRKAELPPPGREMPQRATRGTRMGALVKDAEGEQADEEFWNQEFFREEEQDEVYETESEPDDVADADFSESENEAEEDEGEAEADARAKEPKKKALKPPGYRKPPLPPRPKPPGSTGMGAAGGGASGGKAGAPRKRQPSVDSGHVFERRAVRDSTRQKVAEAEEERQLQAALKPRRVIRQSNYRPLNQAELLAEAAKTEIENTKSLQALVALEEQTKKKAEVKKAKYKGPMVRFLSKAVDGQERSTMEVRNMQTPPELLPQAAPPPPLKPVCAVTGLPAKYRDPRTGLPYASLEAYKVLQQQAQHQRAQQAFQTMPPQWGPVLPQAQLQQQQQQWQPQQFQQFQLAAMGQSWQPQQVYNT